MSMKKEVRCANCSNNVNKKCISKINCENYSNFNNEGDIVSYEKNLIDMLEEEKKDLVTNLIKNEEQMSKMQYEINMLREKCGQVPKIQNYSEEKKQYNTCYNKSCTSCELKSLSCLRSENRYNSCNFRMISDIASTDNKNIKPSYYHKGNVDTIKFCIENKLDFLQGSIVKYVVRYKEKNGLEDLNKSMEFLKRLIESEVNK